jgi:hypothetical protein
LCGSNTGDEHERDDEAHGHGANGYRVAEVSMLKNCQRFPDDVPDRKFGKTSVVGPRVAG